MVMDRMHPGPQEITRLLLVRHGETVWNQEQRYQGQTNVELSDFGRRQAQAVRDRLAEERIDVVYASDLGRAAETADIIVAGRELRPVLLSNLREASFGEWEGLTHTEIVARYPGLMERRETDLADTAPPEGESLRQLQSRIVETIHSLAQRHRGQTVLIATHGGPVRTFVCDTLGIDLNQCWRIRVDNAALFIVQMYPAGGIVDLLNEQSYLRGLRA
jgi:alpha-ribazole phosphatase